MKCFYVLATLGIAMVFLPAAAKEPVFQRDGESLHVDHEGGRLTVSLSSPMLFFRDVEDGVGGVPPESIHGTLSAGEVDAAYAPVKVGETADLEVRLLLRWEPREQVLRKWVSVKVANTSAPLVLEEILLEELEADKLREDPRTALPRSTPVFLPGFFAGIEFPVAAVRVEDARVLVAHRPRVALEAGDTFESRCAVYGLAKPGRERDAFHRYIEMHRPAPRGLHFNYNSWWTSPVPFSEQNILDIMTVFEKELYQAHGVAPDSFTIDMGWSNPDSIWEIDPILFPEGFSRIEAAAARMGSRLGLWVSPSSFYSPALNPEWAREQGYESFEFSVPWSVSPVRLLSLGGERYASRFKERLTDMVSRFGIRQVKLDGYFLGKDTFDAGPFGAEQTAEGGIAAFQAVRAIAPEVWFEGTFDANASPWWLFHLNSVIGGFGDDSPYGRVPCPVYRESYTTARDYYNLQAADRLFSPVPAQEILGIIHQSDDCFMNDAVMCLLRGNAFISLYINPKYMNPARWAQLAETLRWARSHEGMLVDTPTEVLRPEAWLRDGIPWQSHDAPMPRMPYGYAHWDDAGGTVALRNPWVAPQSYRLALPDGLAQENINTRFDVISLYPEPRWYAARVTPGDTVEVPLAPYETLVLNIRPASDNPGLAEVGACINNSVVVESCVCHAAQVHFEEETASLGPNWTEAEGFDAGMLEVSLDARVRVDAPQARLLVLTEGKETAPRLLGKLQVNEAPLEMRATGSIQGFAASTAPPPEHWTFLEAVLPAGTSTLALTASTETNVSDLSVWVWAWKPGGEKPDYPDALPAPERISMGGAFLLAPDAFKADLKEETRKRRIEHINGVYLDALEPLFEQQGWGTLQQNKSVWERPMTIAGHHFRRGLGVHAVSEVVYALDKQYTLFESQVGMDGANRGTGTFEVWVDKVKKWESKRMNADDRAEPVRVEVNGASELRLRVGDGGDGIIGDHANWAEARLLR